MAADPAEQLRQAQAEVGQHLEQLAAELRSRGNDSEAAIFDAQALLATDPALATEAERHLSAGASSLQAAVSLATEALAQQLASLDDAYLRERAADVRAVGQQLESVLSGSTLDLQVPLDSIVISPELTPAQLMTLRAGGIVGFATVHGATTGHLALLARALGLPALVGGDEALLSVADGSLAILADDRLLVDPTPADLAHYGDLLQARQQAARDRERLVGQPTITADRHLVQVWANLGQPDEAEPALLQGAEGVGLFRTEFLFLGRGSPPSEDEQCAAYAQVLRVMAGRPVVVRTLDVGGDKPLPYLPPLADGMRGIRFCMRYPELFQTQLRALLRAAPSGDLKIMLPMVATAEDVVWARSQLASTEIPLGIMVETPAAVVMLDRLVQAGQLQFCSIGSNDLAQYTLAADRADAALAQRYRPDDPSVFRLIRHTLATARALDLDVSLCGDLAATASVPLVGLGLTRLSVPPPAILEVKSALRRVTLTEAQQQASLACGDAPEPLGPFQGALRPPGPPA